MSFSTPDECYLPTTHTHTHMHLTHFLAIAQQNQCVWVKNSEHSLINQKYNLVDQDHQASCCICIASHDT